MSNKVTWKVQNLMKIKNELIDVIFIFDWFKFASFKLLYLYQGKKQSQSSVNNPCTSDFFWGKSKSKKHKNIKSKSKNVQASKQDKIKQIENSNEHDSQQ